MQTRSHTRGEHIPALPFEIWAIVLSILCKTAEDFPERCRLQRVCRAFRLDEHTLLPCDKKLSLTSSVKKGLLNAMVTCKRAFANIMELNLHNSLLDNGDQLALSAVSWPHLGYVFFNNSGIFDRPCALFLKKWLNTICDAVKVVIIDLSGCRTDLLTFHYICKWLNDTRVKYVRSMGVLPMHVSDYLLHLIANIENSYDDFLDCQLKFPLMSEPMVRSMDLKIMGTSMSSRNLPMSLENILKNPKDYYSTSKAPRTTELFPECLMEQDWYMENYLVVKLVMGKGRTSGRGQMSIFTRESSY